MDELRKHQRDNFERIKLEVGDTLLLEGSKERMSELFASGDFINLSEVKPAKRAQPTAPEQQRKSRSLIYSIDFAAMNALMGFLTDNCCGGNAALCAPVCKAAASPKQAIKTRRIA